MSKVVLITGASSGIGKSIGEFLLKKKFKVYGTSRNPSKYLNTKIELIKSNINSVDDIDNCVKYILMKEGTLDVLINNAGIAIPVSIDDKNYEESWDRTFDVLLKGQVNLIRASLPFMLKSSCARIVNISSTEGMGATPRQSPYTAAKHGVIGLTRSLATELGSQGITVNCICPGPIRTAMTAGIPEEHKEIYSRRRVPLKRYGEPEEVAHMTLSLCLPAASFVNGAVLPVDGGLSIKRA